MSLIQANLSLIISLWKSSFFIAIPCVNETQTIHAKSHNYNELGVRLLAAIDRGLIPSGYESLSSNIWYKGKIAVEIRDYRCIKDNHTQFMSTRRWLELTQPQMIDELIEKALKQGVDHV